MVRAGCVFVAGIHPSRTWTSGSFESVRWNACMHRLDLGLYSDPKEFWGNGVWTHVNSKGKIPSTGKCPQRRIEPATLWQRAQALPTELFRPPPPGSFISLSLIYCVKSGYLYSTLCRSLLFGALQKYVFDMSIYAHVYKTWSNLSMQTWTQITEVWTQSKANASLQQMYTQVYLQR